MAKKTTKAKTTTTVTTCALYIRVSTRSQSVNGDSPPEQVRQLHRHAKYKRYKVVRVIEDVASGKNMRRPGFIELAKLMSTGKIDRVLILDVSRMVRGPLREWCGFIDLCKKHSVVLETSQGFDSSTIEGEMVMTILATIATAQRKYQNKRTSDAIQHLKATGVRYSTIPPFGYRFEKTRSRTEPTKLVEDKIEQRILATARKLRGRQVHGGDVDDRPARWENSAEVVARSLFKRGMRNRKGRVFDRKSLLKAMDSEPPTLA